jgi:hypothetical protein
MTLDTDRGLMDELRKNTFRWIDQHAADAASAFAHHRHVVARGPNLPPALQKRS